MRMLRRYWLDGVVLAFALVVFVVPFAFIALTAVKDRAAAIAPPGSSTRWCSPG